VEHEGLYRYCRFWQLEKAIELGWIKVVDLHMPHGAYSCLLKWPGFGMARWPWDPRDPLYEGDSHDDDSNLRSAE
jgi:hypothetical protein